MYQGSEGTRTSLFNFDTTQQKYCIYFSEALLLVDSKYIVLSINIFELLKGV